MTKVLLWMMLVLPALFILTGVLNVVSVEIDEFPFGKYEQARIIRTAFIANLCTEPIYFIAGDCRYLSHPISPTNSSHAAIHSKEARTAHN